MYLMLIHFFACFCRWMPNHYPTEVIGTIIRRQFRGLYHPSEAVPEHMQHIWWDEFKVCIHHVFNQV